MRNFVIALVLGAAIGIGCTKAIDQPVVANATPVINDMTEPGAAFGVAHFILPEGTDEEAFGEYLADEVIPEWQSIWEKGGTGVKINLIQGERGDKMGKYGILMQYPDIETRNRYFSADGQTDEYKELIADIKIDVPDLMETYEGLEMVHLGDQVILPTK